MRLTWRMIRSIWLWSILRMGKALKEWQVIPENYLRLTLQTSTMQSIVFWSGYWANHLEYLRGIDLLLFSSDSLFMVSFWRELDEQASLWMYHHSFGSRIQLLTLHHTPAMDEPTSQS